MDWFDLMCTKLACVGLTEDCWSFWSFGIFQILVHFTKFVALVRKDQFQYISKFVSSIFDNFPLKALRDTVFMDNMREKSAVNDAKSTSTTGTNTEIDANVWLFEEVHVPYVATSPQGSVIYLRTDKCMLSIYKILSWWSIMFLSVITSRIV